MTLFNFAWNNVMRSKRTYLAYFLSCTCSVFVFFSFAVSLFHPNLSVIDSHSTLGLTMGVGTVIVYCFAFMFIAYSMNAFLKTRMNQFGLLTILGTSKKQLNKIIFIENIVIGVSSIIIGMGLGIIFEKFFLLLSAKVMHVENFNMYFPCIPIIITGVLFLILFFMVSLLIPRMIRRKEIIKLLKSEAASEKPVKFHAIFTIIGIACWGVLLIFREQIFYEDNLIYGAIIALTIGTYFLFHQVLGAILSLIKKLHLYYHKTNMITVSGISSKSQSNAQIMMLVCILYMISFFSIIALTAMSKNVESVTRKNQPIAYLYVDRGSPEKTSAHLATIEDILKNKKGYQSAAFDFLMDNKRQGYISVNDYNKVMVLLHRPTISIEDNELYLVPGNSYTNNVVLKEETKHFLEQNTDASLTLVGQADACVITSGYFSLVYVISDSNYSKLVQLENLNVNHMFGYEIYEWNTNASEASKMEELAYQWTVVENDNNQLSFMGASVLYQTERQAKNLALYLGFLLCFVFLLSTASLIYFKLYTELDRECKRFKGIVKMGLSKRELSKIIFHEVFTVLILPFLLAFIYMWLGVFALSQTINFSIMNHAIICSILFILIQTILFYLVNTIYRRAIFRGVFLSQI